MSKERCDTQILTRHLFSCSCLEYAESLRVFIVPRCVKCDTDEGFDVI